LDKRSRDMPPPLQGIKVLDFGVAYASPFGAMMLGDMGADVIKIERIEGESIRRGRAAAMDDLDIVTGQEPDAPSFIAVNRSKRCLAIDIRQERGREIILQLAKDVDVIIECFRPGVMDRLGLGYGDLSKVNPRIIYCSQSGFGEEGPLARKIGGDMWAQAMGGVVSYQGSPGGPPYLTGVSFVDQGTPAIMAFGIMVALYVRERTGIGQHLTTSLLQSVMHMQTVETSDYLIDGILKTKMGRGLGGLMPAGAYRAKDGDVITIYGSGSQWPTLCKILGIEHLENDPRFSTDEKRVEHREELYPILDEAFSKKTRAEWQKLFKEAKMRCDPSLNYEELFSHPHIEANKMVISKIKNLAPPVKFKTTQAMPHRSSPLLGQHTEEILLALGYSAADIHELEKQGVINTGKNVTKSG
jgi:crotonobetainyl-CoA:carnitine CoA-transferase CaiB-like acyl-CoA transferase